MRALTPNMPSGCCIRDGRRTRWPGPSVPANLIRLVVALHTGWILFHARRYEEAIRELRSVLAVDPDSVPANWFLGLALIANGQPEEAIPVLEKALSLTNRNPAMMGVLVRAYAHAGRREEALRLVDELKRTQQKGYVPAATFVNAYLGLGDNEQALAWLERAYQEQSNILQLIKVFPYFDPSARRPTFCGSGPPRRS